MLKVMEFLVVNKQGLDTGELIDYYERHHVPLILSLAPAPTHQRNYLVRDAAINGPDDFDIVTEPSGRRSPTLA
jgi:EthD domain